MPARGGNRGDVDAPERRVDRGFEPQHLRPIADDALGLPQLFERHEPGLDRVTLEQVRQQVQRAAVNRRAAHHLVA
jgi:hypothetical protein